MRWEKIVFNICVFSGISLYAPAQDFRVMSVSRDRALTWTQELANGAATVEQCANPDVGYWVPARHVFATGTLWMAQLATAEQSCVFYRVQSVDISSVPTGMALVPAGCFEMGYHYAGGEANEYPLHSLYISTFYMDKFEVSNEKVREVFQWAYTNGLIDVSDAGVTNKEGQRTELLDMDAKTISTGHPWCFIRFTNGVFTVISNMYNFPVTAITWYGAQAFCNYMSDMEGLQRCINFTNWSCDFSKKGYRLPTEAEWEKAARGGLTGHHYSWESYGGSWNQHINGSMGNYQGNYDLYEPGLDPVGYYNGNQMIVGKIYSNDMANGYGLYDMAGNAAEWCWDYFQDNWYLQPQASSNDCTGPTGPLAGRVVRSYGCGYYQVDLRCAHRHVSWSPTYKSGVLSLRCVRRP